MSLHQAINNSNTIASFLKKMGLQASQEESRMEDGTVVPYVHAPVKTRNKSFDLMVICHAKCIHAKIPVLKLPEQIKNNSSSQAFLYLFCLQASYDLHGVTFSADQKGDIYVESDIWIPIDFETFQEEIASMIGGVNFFFEEMEKMAGT